VDHQLIVVHSLVELVFDSLNEVIVEHFVIAINKDLLIEIHSMVLNYGLEKKAHENKLEIYADYLIYSKLFSFSFSCSL
jgi:hypothetical protein